MKNFINIILIFTLTYLFSGCSQSATSVFDKDPMYGQNIQYSKILKVIEKENVKAMLNITYLNSVDSWEWNNDKQNFLIGVFTVDNDENNYTLDMNGLEVISKKPLPENHELTKNIAFKNHWAKYYIVSFNNVDEKILKLTYSYKNLQNSVSFLKE